MAPSHDELNRIAKQAEADLNSYQAKQGLNNASLDDAGVDSDVEKKFPGAGVKYDTDLSTSSSYNKRIPPQEGGELDDRGRQAKNIYTPNQGHPRSPPDTSEPPTC